MAQRVLAEQSAITNLNDHRKQLQSPGNNQQYNLLRTMSDTPTRAEMSAELRAAEARTETRIAQLNSSMEVRAAATDHKIDALIGKIEGLSTAISEVKADSKVTRNTVAGISLAIAALIVALWIAGVNGQSNVIAAFQIGLGMRSLPESPAATNPVVSPPQVPGSPSTPAKN